MPMAADPERRDTKRGVSNDEIKSPIRPPDYVPPVRRYKEAQPGHFVQAWDIDWI